ncbi:MAG: hypothetical protein RLZZ453_1036 [Chlamydiota bacterium]|jgi:manganese/zinc/iron transport system substrate-binding protein
MRLFFLLTIFFSSCSNPISGTAEWMKKNNKLKVLCTTGMIHDLVSEIGGERVDSIALIQAEVDPHSYELVKGDDEKFSLAQIIFYNGLGLEHGASLHYQLQSHPHAINLGGSVKQQFPQEIIYIDNQEDPHIWMDIRLFSLVINPIIEALSAQDPDGHSFYVKQGIALRAKLLEAHEITFSIIQSIPEEKRYIVTSHDAFNYFTKAYLATKKELDNDDWKKRFDAPEGLAPEGQLSSFDIAEVVQHLMQYHIHVVFPESNVSSDSLKKIIDACAQKGFKVTLSSDVLYGDALGPKHSIAAHYPGMIEYDATTLKKNLGIQP